MDKETEILQKFGLSEKEARCYLSLLKKENASSGELIKELGYYSKTFYDVINKLIDKGLASFVIKSNVKYFEAANPEKFFNIIDEQEEQLKDKRQLVSKTMPVLKSIRNLLKEQQEATIYKGIQGLKSVFDDSLKEKNKEILVFGGGGKSNEFLGGYMKLWHKKRISKRIKLRLLWNEDLRGKKEDLLKSDLIEVRFLPKEFNNPSPAMIYDNKVALTIWSSTPIAILVKSSEVNRSNKTYFELLWKIAKNP